ncbi:hypothetical protein DICPUDRAFT_149427 [Dictyostelium purpureum]|uniref:CENP-V/GFA domain-containing protein n=1 Tax=Dictyostelium purpureum TaxID=5786 RepID=F0ZDQ0_DICPU|nr:uncharacterized protein DICPUDRAFT_149427 [Dictyostelium purpureum]EGC37973.1 hypothetical protein DICPUDRAFT_149427 [Dictyostelium purpureum]|eukprot:XP_003285544.1 hypothetical protein DICPUDRAFT_149427 [Dictyostelium purpureum]
MSNDLKTGGCHCGKVRFEVVKASNDQENYVYCNCSICTKKGIIHYIVPKTSFKLLQGEDILSLYTFNTVQAVVSAHICKYILFIPRSHPNDIDVNARCFDDFDITQVKIRDFDGKNWEQNVKSIQ